MFRRKKTGEGILKSRGKKEKITALNNRHLFVEKSA